MTRPVPGLPSPVMPALGLGPGAHLRPLVAGDAAAVHALVVANRAHLDRWLRWSSVIRAPADAADFIERFTGQLANGDGFHLGIWVGTALAGGCICWTVHRQDRNAEVGYWLGAAFLGRGLATAATRAVVGHLFAAEQLHRIELQCGVGNVRSRAVAERLGFRLEGVRRQSHWITDRFVDHAVYAMLAPDWPGAAASAGQESR